MNNGDKTLCRANLFVGEEEPTQIRCSTSEPLPHLICQHESIIIKAHTHKLCALIMPPNIASTIFNSRVHLQGYGVWRQCVLKMVSSMHNEADAEDYIVWHKI